MSPSSGSRRTPMPPTTFAQGLQNSTALPSDAEESIACGRKGRRAGGFSYWKTACVVLLFCAATTFATASPIYKQLFHFSGTDGDNSNSLVQEPLRNDSERKGLTALEQSSKSLPA